VIRILIADDHAILRRGLKEILVRELEGAVCGEANDATEVLARIQDGDWDLAILDITMPGRSFRYWSSACTRRTSMPNAS
jgi:DNA-binding NarL/FixJ family response regulator